MIKFPFNNSNKNIFSNDYEDRFLKRLKIPKNTSSPRIIFDFTNGEGDLLQDFQKLKINQLKYNRNFVDKGFEFNNVIATSVSLDYFPYANRLPSSIINLLTYNSPLFIGRDKARVLKSFENIYPILLAKYQKIKNDDFLAHDAMLLIFLRKFKKDLFSQTHFWGNAQPAHSKWLIQGKGNFSFKGIIMKKARGIYFYILFYTIMLFLLPRRLFNSKIRFFLNPNKLDFEGRNLEFFIAVKYSLYFIYSIRRCGLNYVQTILYYLHKDWKDYRNFITNKYFIKILNGMLIRVHSKYKKKNLKFRLLLKAGFFNTFRLPFDVKNISFKVAEFDCISTPQLSLRQIYSIMDLEKCNESFSAIPIPAKKDYIQKLPISYGALKTNYTFINVGINYKDGRRGGNKMKLPKHAPISIKSKPYFVFFDQYENVPLKFRLLMIKDMAWAVKQNNGLLVVRPHPIHLPYKETGRPVKKDFSLAEKSCGVISFYSTATFKAVLENIPSILYNYTSQENYSIVDAYDNGICFDVREKEELAVVMADILAKGPLYRNQMRARREFFKTYPYYADQYSSEREEKLSREVYKSAC